LFPPIERSAVLSDDGRYRYRLDRWWGTGPRLVWVMLNPSTADADVDDPTIRRCVAFARRDGYTGITVVNLCAWRATDPQDLVTARSEREDIHGPDNDRHLAELVAPDSVAAWGATGMGLVAAAALHRFPPLRCLGVTKAGWPRHPLYVPSDAAFVPWRHPSSCQ
jgi:hypothetical protein